MTLSEKIAKYRAQWELTNDVLENRLPDGYDHRIRDMLWMARYQAGSRALYYEELAEYE